MSEREGIWTTLKGGCVSDIEIKDQNGLSLICRHDMQSQLYVGVPIFGWWILLKILTFPSANFKSFHQMTNLKSIHKMTATLC